MLEALKGLPKASAVSVPVEPILLSRALSEETFRAGAVFVCLPMTEGGDLEASCVDMINLTIMENWKKRNNSSNNRGRLVHLNAAPQKMGKARDVWLGFHGTHGFVSLLDIQGERVRCASHVDDLRRKATEAISYMAACRYDGNRRVTEVALDCATMQLRFKGAKPPPAYYAG